MTALYLPVAGVYTKVKKLSVSDANGAYQAVRNGWISDSTGTYRKVWPSGATITSLNVVPGNPSWQQLLVSWAGIAATNYELRLAGSSTVLYYGTGTAFTFNGIPGQSYTFTLRAYASDGSYSDSLPVTGLLSALPAPTNFRQGTADTTSATFYWDAVPAATGYDYVDTLTPGTPTLFTGPGTGVIETNLTPGTTYERAARTRMNSATSGLSNKVRYQTLPQSSVKAGTYSFKPTRIVAWSPGRGIWRPVGDGPIHGNGDNWGGNNGNQGTVFFYNLAPIRALIGRCTRFKIALFRDSVAGYSSPQSNQFWQCTNETQPGGAPALYNPISAGSFSWGQSGPIDLPVAWGQNMIESGGVNSIAWGFCAGRYMRGPTGSVQSVQGQISFTIG